MFLSHGISFPWKHAFMSSFTNLIKNVFLSCSHIVVLVLAPSYPALLCLKYYYEDLYYEGQSSTRLKTNRILTVWFDFLGSPNLRLTQYEVLNLDGVLTSSSPWSGRTEASSYNSSRSCPLRWSPFFLSISNCWLVISYSRIFLDHSSPGKRLKLPNHVVRL